MHSTKFLFLLSIGPNQPQDGIYSAWFDEGRIVEKLDQHNANWINLGKIRGIPY